MRLLQGKRIKGVHNLRSITGVQSARPPKTSNAVPHRRYDVRPPPWLQQALHHQADCNDTEPAACAHEQRLAAGFQ